MDAMVLKYGPLGNSQDSNYWQDTWEHKVDVGMIKALHRFAMFVRRKMEEQNVISRKLKLTSDSKLI
jgi:hypothetical protein